jgi:formate/nitrite transporter FocA (FNT family)
MGSENAKYIGGMVLLGLIAIGLYAWSFIMVSNNIDSKDDLDKIKQALPKIWGLTISGSIAISLACLFYFVYDSDKAMTIMLFLSCLTFGLTYSALCFSLLSKLGIS